MGRKPKTFKEKEEEFLSKQNKEEEVTTKVQPSKDTEKVLNILKENGIVAVNESGVLMVDVPINADLTAELEKLEKCLKENTKYVGSYGVTKRKHLEKLPEYSVVELEASINKKRGK